MTGAPDSARECFALAEAAFVRGRRTEVVPQLFALCPEGQRALFFEGVIDMGTCDDAVRFHQMGCNCAQSVLAACGKYTGLDRDTALSIAAGFGGGVRSGEICGAISGAVMAIGLVEQDKRKVAALARDCLESFRRDFGCVRCLELKQNRVSCDDLIAYGAAYMDNLMKSKEGQE